MSYIFIGLGVALILGAVLYGLFGPPEDVSEDPDGLVILPFNGEGVRCFNLWVTGLLGVASIFFGLAFFWLF